MIKLKSLLSEKYLGFGFGAGKVKEQQLPDASATDLAQGLNRDPMTGNPMPGGAGGNINLDYKEIKLDQLKFDDLVKLFRTKDYFNDVHFNRTQPDGQEGPYYRDGLSFPNPSDASSIVADMKSLENWKEKTKRRFGNVKIILDPNAEEHWEKVKVDDARFLQDKQTADAAKMDMLKQWGSTT
jgi:hypothetical protein